MRTPLDQTRSKPTKDQGKGQRHQASAFIALAHARARACSCVIRMRSEARSLAAGWGAEEGASQPQLHISI
jgi:hypothetical protein